MLALYFTDVHVHNYRNYDVNGSRLKNTLDVIERIFEFADANGIKYILFSGDLLEKQQVIPTIVQNELTALFKRLFETYEDIHFIAISGNHDQALSQSGKVSLSALDTVKESRAVSGLYSFSTIFDRFVLIDNDIIDLGDCLVAGVPYYEHSQELNDAITSINERVVRKEKKAFLMIHQTPSGLRGSYGNIPIDIDCDSELFECYDRVFCGHIHAKHDLGKVLVGGSPIQSNFGDSSERKGFYAYNLSNNKSKFIDLTDDYPKFISINEGEVVDEALEESSYVKVIPAIKAVTEEESERLEKYRVDNSAETLLRNYWEEVDGNDTSLLDTGLSFLKI